MSAYRKYMPRPARLILVVILIYAFFWVKGWPRRYDDEELPPSKRPNQGTSGGPHQVDPDELVVSVTTTANDVYAKVAPLILNTAEEDYGTLLLFSDLQTEIGKWPVFDVIWRYASDLILASGDLERYRAQIDYTRGNIPLHRLKKENAEEEKKEMATLDKYKILQAMAAAWEFRPNRSWYVFTGDETYINRPGLLYWLSQHDPDSKHFFGSSPTPATSPGPDPFAAGASSFIVSRQVMKELFKEPEDVILKWEEQIANHTSAFNLVSSVLQAELNVSLVSAWPGISGFDPTTVPFSPALWCEPVLIMHHITPDMGSHLFKMEREWANSQTQVRFADLWNTFMTPEKLNYTRNDWDNLSSEPSNAPWNILFQRDQHDADRARTGEESPEACQQSCDDTKYCMQWSYSSTIQENWNDNPKTKCHLSGSIRFGAHAEPQEWNLNGESSTLTWKSGWRSDKFIGWAIQQRCKEQHE
jgi:hypothetical protein